MTKPSWRPSNSSEGAAFQEAFCDRCMYRKDPENGDGCWIENIALIGEQPAQWICDKHGPRCTSFWPDRSLEDADERCDQTISFNFEENVND